ncbi:hypothetical protein [Bacillus atrophaeus]|nr:hypothetical protein [Bacillus atrophaeus]
MHARNAKMIVAIGVQKSAEIVLMLVVKLAAAKILYKNYYSGIQKV